MPYAKPNPVVVAPDALARLAAYCHEHGHTRLLVVADANTLAPQAFTRANRSADGKPKWKLTTGGVNSASRLAGSARKGCRAGAVAMLAAAMPSAA